MKVKQEINEKLDYEVKILQRSPEMGKESLFALYRLETIDPASAGHMVNSGDPKQLSHVTDLRQISDYIIDF